MRREERAALISRRFAKTIAVTSREHRYATHWERAADETETDTTLCLGPIFLHLLSDQPNTPNRFRFNSSLEEQRRRCFISRPQNKHCVRGEGSEKKQQELVATSGCNVSPRFAPTHSPVRETRGRGIRIHHGHADEGVGQGIYLKNLHPRLEFNVFAAPQLPLIRHSLIGDESSGCSHRTGV